MATVQQLEKLHQVQVASLLLPCLCVSLLECVCVRSGVIENVFVLCGY